MKAKDLQVGMCVAVKDGYTVKQAWVLEVPTAWWCSYSGWQRHHTADPKSVAVAVVDRLVPDLRPSVVRLPQVLDTWERYRAKEAADQEESRKEYEKDQRRRADYRSRFEKLNLGEHAQLEKGGYVRVRLDVLEARLGDKVMTERLRREDGKV